MYKVKKFILTLPTDSIANIYAMQEVSAYEYKVIKPLGIKLRARTTVMLPSASILT